MKQVFLILSILLFSLAAFAQIDLPQSTEIAIDYGVLLSQVIANPKALISVSGIALAIYLTVQFLKTEKAKQIFKGLTPKKQFALIAILGQAYAFVVITFVFKDAEISKFLVGLFSSGGAAALYEAFKNLFKKEA